jgi:hypothetical protein
MLHSFRPLITRLTLEIAPCARIAVQGSASLRRPVPDPRLMAGEPAAIPIATLRCAFELAGFRVDAAWFTCTGRCRQAPIAQTQLARLETHRAGKGAAALVRQSIIPC